MAKKVKRQTTRSERANTPAAPQAASNNGSGTRYPVRSSAPTGSSSEFNPDYSYVRGDLRRIAILAGSFITILVVLSFFLR